MKLDLHLQAEAMNLGVFSVLVENLHADQQTLLTKYSKDSLDFKLHVKSLSKVWGGRGHLRCSSLRCVMLWYCAVVVCYGQSAPTKSIRL